MTVGVSSASRREKRLGAAVLAVTSVEFAFAGVCLVNGWRDAAAVSLAMWLPLSASLMLGHAAGELVRALRSRERGASRAVVLVRWMAPRAVRFLAVVVVVVVGLPPLAALMLRAFS